jgi:peptidoglycan/xylan/chitin deacetylase (PgdA/CDA1 family)
MRVLGESMLCYPKIYSRNLVSPRKSIIFRYDDIPFDFLENKGLFCNAELAVMDLFIKRNQKLSLALVTKYLEQNLVLCNKIGEGLEKDLFEPAIHGWEHTDFSRLDEHQQVQFLFNATKRVENIFKARSTVFIPPYNSFNARTLVAMKKVGLRIISSELDLDKNGRLSTISLQVENASNSGGGRYIYHMPQMTGFEEFRNYRLFRIDLKKIIGEIDVKIARYGYAVITMHPQSFMESINGVYNGDLDIQQLNNLEVLIDKLISKNIEINTFSGVIQANQS